MTSDIMSAAVPVSPDGEDGARPEIAAVASPPNSLEVWERKLPRQEAFTLARIAATFNVAPSGVGMVALVSELTLDFAQLRTFFQLPEWVTALGSLRAGLLQLGLDPARDVVTLRRQPMSPLRQFLSPPGRTLTLGEVQVVRALRAMVAIKLLAARERLSQPIGKAIGHLLAGEVTLRLDVSTVDEPALRACWAEFEPTVPTAKLLAYCLEIVGRVLPNPFQLPRPAVVVAVMAEIEPTPVVDEDCDSAESPGHAAGDLLDAALAEPSVAGVRLFSGIAVLNKALAPYELESTISALVSIWTKTGSEECLAAFFTLFFRVMPSAFAKVGLSLAAGTWLFVDPATGRYGWRLAPVQTKLARDPNSQEWIDSQIIWIPLPLEIANLLRGSGATLAEGTLASLFSTPLPELARNTKRLLRAIAGTSHRPTLSRLARTWARYLLRGCRDEVYASAIGCDLTVGTVANFNYATLRGARLRQICAEAYRRLGFSGELPPDEIPDVLPARLPTRAAGEAFVRSMHAEMKDVLGHLPQNLRVEALVEKHNRLARAFYATWKFLLAARPLQEETTTGFRIGLESGLVGLTDKRVSPYHERRVVLLPQTMQAWLAVYVCWLRVLANRVSRVAPNLAQAILSVTHLQWDGDRHPFFFRLKSGLTTVALGTEDLSGAFAPFSFESNAGRSFVDEIFRAAGLGSADVMGWAGRGNPGQEICGSSSSVVPLAFMALCANALEAWLQTLSLPALQLIEPRLLIEKAGRWREQYYVPRLLETTPEWADAPGVVQACPFQDDSVALAAAFPRFIRAWRSGASPSGWTGVAISLVIEDGVCTQDELEAAMTELQRGTVCRLPSGQFVDGTSPRLGLRRVWLSDTTLRLFDRAATAPDDGADWSVGLAGFTSQVLQAGSALELLLASARAYFTLRVPGVLSAWKKGEVFARTSRPQSVARFQTGFCEVPTLAGFGGICRQTLSKTVSSVVNDALKDIERGDAHETVLAAMQAAFKTVQADSELGSLFWFEAGYGLYLARVLKNAYTLSRYLSGCHKFLQQVSDAADTDGFGDIAWPVLIARSLPEEEREPWLRRANQGVVLHSNKASTERRKSAIRPNNQ